MPIVIAWNENEKNIVLLTFPTKWNWDEFKQAAYKTAELLVEVDQMVDIIIDLKNSTIPLIGSPFEAGNMFFKMMPHNRGVIIVVTNAFIRSLASIFKTIDREFGALLYPVDTLDEGIAISRTQRTRRQATR
jgi:hypothetical protein